MTQLDSGLLFATFGGIILWIAHHLHFFRLKSLLQEDIRLRFVPATLLGYSLIFFIIIPLSANFLSKNSLITSPPLFLTVLQAIALAWTLSYLTLFSFLQRKSSYRALWVHKDRMRFSCFAEDFGLGVLTYLIALPIVMAVSQLSDYFTLIITGKPKIEQLAILYLKMVKESPILLSIALFIILILAPVIEEFIFRGVLYTYLKQKVKRCAALILSSAIFALFHFAPKQGMSNISLLLSLFVFALFLGFLYERQRSMIAPIALHMTFNFISVIRILLF